MDTHVEHCQPESEVVSALLSVYVACMLGSIYEHRQNMAAVEVLCYSGGKKYYKRHLHGSVRTFVLSIYI